MSSSMAASVFTLLSCGSNAHGQLGNGSVEDGHTFRACSFADFSPSAIPNDARILDIACGANHTLLLLELDGKIRELWGCGDGRKGQLGMNYRQNVSATGVFRKLDLSLWESSLEQCVIKAIGATWETSFVVLSGDKDVVISMGSDDYGDLGVGGLEKSQRGLRDFYIVEFNLEEKYNISGIYCGQRHVIVHVNTTSGSYLFGWGTARHGQLGELGVPFAATPQIVSIDSSNVSSLGLGMQHTVLLSNTGELHGLGSNRKYQLDVVRNPPLRSLRLQMTCCTWNGTYVVERSEGNWIVHSSGSDSHGQLGWKSESGTTTGKITFPGAESLSISCGSEHVLVLEKAHTSDSPRLWGWGWNEHGNLGLGHTQDISSPVRLYNESEDKNVKIIKMWAGLGTSWVLTERIVP